MVPTEIDLDDLEAGVPGLMSLWERELMAEAKLDRLDEGHPPAAGKQPCDGDPQGVKHEQPGGLVRTED